MTEMNDQDRPASGTHHARMLCAVLALFILAHGLWMICLKILPFVDLPFHLAAATIYRYIGQPGNCFAEFYRIPTLLTSNVVHMVFTGSSLFPSVEFGNRVFYVLTVGLLPVSMLLLLRRIGGNAWFAVPALLFVYNFNVFWGFTGYSIGVPVVLLYLYVLAGYCERPSWKKGLGLSLFLVFIFFIHFQLALFAGLLLALSVLIACWRTPGRVAVSACIALPVLALMVWSYAHMGQADHMALGDDLFNYYRTSYWQKFDDRMFQFLTVDFYPLLDAPKGRSFAPVFYLLAALPLIVGLLALPFQLFRKKVSASGWRRINAVVPAFFLCSLACFFVLPRDLQGQSVVYQRFMVFLALSVVLISGVVVRPSASGWVSRILAVYLVATAGFHFVVASRCFWQFSKTVRPFEASIFPEGGTCKVLAPLKHALSFHTLPVYLHDHMYFTVWKKGITSGLVDYRFGAVRRNVGEDRLPAYRDWDMRPPEPRTDPNAATRELLEYKGYLNVDYLLVRNDEPVRVDGFKLARAGAPWYLFERE